MQSTLPACVERFEDVAVLALDDDMRGLVPAGS